MTFGYLHLNQKTNENISLFLPYLSKIGPIKNECKVLYVLEDEYLLISMIVSNYFYDLTHFRG